MCSEKEILFVQLGFEGAQKYGLMSTSPQKDWEHLARQALLPTPVWPSFVDPRSTSEVKQIVYE